MNAMNDAADPLATELVSVTMTRTQWAKVIGLVTYAGPNAPGVSEVADALELAYSESCRALCREELQAAKDRVAGS